jgi:hypothetical protein
MKICGKLLCLVFLETQRKALLQKTSKQISRYCTFKQRHPLIFITFLEQVKGTKYLIDLDPLTMSKYMNDVVKFFQSEKAQMSSFIKADVRQTNEYGASFSHFLFDTLSKLADRSTEQVKSGQGCNLHICGHLIQF